MGVLYFLGNALLSVVGSVLGNVIDRLVQSRKKEKSPTNQSRSS